MSYRVQDIIDISNYFYYINLQSHIWTNRALVEIPTKPLPHKLQIYGDWKFMDSEKIERALEALTMLADYEYREAIKVQDEIDRVFPAVYLYINDVKFAGIGDYVRIQRPYYQYIKTRYPNVKWLPSGINTPIQMLDEENRLIGYIMPLAEITLNE